mmetsp:Transcript_40394/g.46353  ORF Transcript_40394/g.46353 Transcript_40394/m.46353 type:complete len:104 (+) Transcript_40394:1460-1771(+)
MSGNFSSVKPVASNSSGESTASKPKVDENKINEILKRIERHTSKSNAPETSETKYKNLINDLKENSKTQEISSKPKEEEKAQGENKADVETKPPTAVDSQPET